MNFKKLLVGTLFLGMCGGALAQYDYTIKLKNTGTNEAIVHITVNDTTTLSNANGSDTNLTVPPGGFTQQFTLVSPTKLSPTDKIVITYSGTNSTAGSPIAGNASSYLAPVASASSGGGTGTSAVDWSTDPSANTSTDVKSLAPSAAPAVQK